VSSRWESGCQMVLRSLSSPVATTNRNTRVGTDVRIGEKVSGSLKPNSLMDEAAIWSTELSAQEVFIIYDAGSTAETTTLDLATDQNGYSSSANGELWWRFEEGKGPDPMSGQHQDTTADSFGNGASRIGYLQDTSGASTLVDSYVDPDQI